MPRWLIDAALAALALISEIRRRRSRPTHLPSTNVLRSFNQPGIMPALLKRHFLQTRHGQMLYRYSGTADVKAPLLVFLHNQSRSSDQFCELIQLCCTRFRCVAPDFLGHGESDKPISEVQIEDYAEHVVQLLDALQAERVFVLGDALGAFVAVELAVRHPTRILRVVLADVDLTPQSLKRLREAITKTPGNEAEYIRDAWETNCASESRELNHRCTMDRLRLWGFDSFGESAMVQYWEVFMLRAREIGSPVMLLWGRDNLRKGEATRLTWQRDGTVVERVMPHAEVVYIKGHVCMMERYARSVFAKIVPFLRERIIGV